ncbi:MAG: glycerophosphodiester phosphodiesterase [Terriglobia bacterium]
MAHPLIIAHRGAPGRLENTLEGFLAGIQAGADWIELDVHQTADSHLVVHHDFTLGGKALAELTLREAKRLARQVKQIELPALEDVIEAVPERIGLGVEIKAPFIGAAVVKTLARQRATGRALLSSFHFPTIRQLAEVRPRVPTGLLTIPRLFDPVKEIRRARAQALCPEHSRCDRRLVREVQQAGFQVFVWTVNREDDLRRMLELRVDGIITDYPTRLRRLLQQTA